MNILGEISQCLFNPTVGTIYDSIMSGVINSSNASLGDFALDASRVTRNK